MLSAALEAGVFAGCKKKPEPTQPVQVESLRVLAIGNEQAMFQHLKDVSGVEEPYLFRDHTHLSDAGRMAATYIWYAEICGLEQMDSVEISNIPAALRHYSTAEEGDLPLSQEYREQVKAAVNYALQNPLTRP